ncbi:MAG: SDR family oxidoreductase [Firmicutes bacterium]|nr:SDR family oxidoreductase [Bacillota bacterium]
MPKKVVLITGASRGIGAATAEEFAKHNYNIVINYNNSEQEALILKEQVERKYGIEALLVKCDISNELEVKQMVEKTVKIFGKIDVLVNNAGIAIDTLFEDKTVENFRTTLDTNLIGTFLVSKYVGDVMLESGDGSIINVASTNGIDTYYPMSLDYDASKAGVISLTHNLALQYSPIIRVNAVAPGWVKTDMNKELDQDFIDTENKKIMLGRFANPDEIAKVIYFLGSNDASYINNEVIRIDGGFKC